MAKRRKNTRKFGKQRYRYFGTFRTKSNAVTMARRIRNRGGKARIVKAGWGWSVYFRKGRKK